MFLPRPLIWLASAALLSTSLAAPSPLAEGQDQLQIRTVLAEEFKSDAEQFDLNWSAGRGVRKELRKRLDMQEREKEKRMWGGGGTATMGEEQGQAAEKRMWGGGGTAVMREGAGQDSQDSEKRMWGGGGTAVMRTGDNKDAEKRMWGGGGTAVMAVEAPDV